MASKYDNRAAGDIIPPPPKVNSFQALTRLRPKKGCEWSTFAFVLNRDMIKSDGSLDELHAVIFPLGSFDDETKAEEHAKNVISITGHPGVIAARYGVPVPLTTKFNPQAVTDVPVDMKGRIIEMESAQYKREREEYEKRVKQERDIMKEAEEETDPDNIEHFKRQCYLAIKNRANYQHHIREADAAWENYKKREGNVRDHYARHPEHEKVWLPYLKDKLIERGEMNLYMSLEAAYGEIRNELLGLDDPQLSCNDIEQCSVSKLNNNQSIDSLTTTSVDQSQVVLQIDPVNEFVKTACDDAIVCECPGLQPDCSTSNIGGICLGLQDVNIGKDSAIVTSCNNPNESNSLDIESETTSLEENTSSDQYEITQPMCDAEDNTSVLDEQDCPDGVCMATAYKVPLTNPYNVECSGRVCKIVKSHEKKDKLMVDNSSQTLCTKNYVLNEPDDDIIGADELNNIEPVNQISSKLDCDFRTNCSNLDNDDDDDDDDDNDDIIGADELNNVKPVNQLSCKLDRDFRNNCSDLDDDDIIPADDIHLQNQ